MANVIEQAVVEFEMRDSGLNPPQNSSEANLDDDGKPRRTGTVWTATAHIITAVIGAGVLSLPWTMAQLGWIAGITILLCFAVITLYTSNLLADCYRSPKRNYTYMDAVYSILGGKMYKACGWIQYGNLAGFVTGYTITTSTSMVAIRKSNCYHRRGHGAASCKFSNIPYMVGVGVVEILLSQIPNFHKLSWLSSIAALMSFGYASIGIALSISRIISGTLHTPPISQVFTIWVAGQGGRSSITGVEVGIEVSAGEKLWTTFRAIGDIAFACSYVQILFDIQVRLAPIGHSIYFFSEIFCFLVGMSTMTTFFLLCGCFGYAAFGNQAPGNMLTGFGFYDPFWLVNLANVMIIVHLIGAYQVLCQPIFRVVETWGTLKWPESKLVNREYPIKFFGMKFRINLMRLIWRTIFVMVVTLAAMVMPFFNAMIALLGAIGYWPLAVYFPVEMHIARKKMEKRSLNWFGLQILSMVCLIVSTAAAFGAIEGLTKGLSKAKPFTLKE